MHNRWTLALLVGAILASTVHAAIFRSEVRESKLNGFEQGGGYSCATNTAYR